MGPYPQEGILEFDYEEVEEFVSKLEDTIADLEEDLVELEKAKADLQAVANSRAIMNYGEYNVDIADCKNSIEFYEAIVADLVDFLESVDHQAKFTRDPNFYYDDQLIEEIEDLTEETEDLRNDNSIRIADREHTPFGPFERGNFFHKGSDEEQLIDHNDGRMEQWAEEVNSILGDLVKSAEKLNRLHVEYFEDITIADWKKSHDWHDGITEHSREIHNIGAITTTMMNLGTIAKGSYNANMGSKAKPKKVSEVSPQEVDDYVGGLLSKKKNNTTSIETSGYPDDFPEHIKNWDYKPPSIENYYKNQKVYDNPKYFDQKNGSAIWPANNGFAGEVENTTLKVGDIIDRYGAEGGKFTSPQGVSFSERALSPASQEAVYHQYEVLRELEVQSGEVAAWFDEIGGGTQYYSELSITELLDEDQLGGAFIKEI